VGAAVNVAINAALIFGLGMGVVGAALGTVVSDLLVTGTFAVGLMRGRLPLVGSFPVRVPAVGSYLDVEVVRQILEIGTPLLFARLARTSARFPKLFLIGQFGAPVVAAYVVGMRVRGLIGTPGYGFGLASSSLVGQELGRDDEAEAKAWARDVLRLSFSVYLLVAGVVAVFAGRVGSVFVDDPAVLPLVTAFIYAACVSNVFRGIDTGARGPLRASGDTRWPMYAQLAGRYAAALPIIYLGLVTPLGILAVYAAVVAEMLVPAAVTLYRYRTGTWLAVSRRYRPDASTSD
jgi:putative MATE family efflux protein